MGQYFNSVSLLIGVTSVQYKLLNRYNFWMKYLYYSIYINKYLLSFWKQTISDHPVEKYRHCDRADMLKEMIMTLKWHRLRLSGGSRFRTQFMFNLWHDSVKHQWIEKPGCIDVSR